MKKQGKEFIFPRNVSKDYGIFRDYTLRDFATGVLPVLLVCIAVLVLPPHNIVVLAIEFTVSCVALTATLALIAVKPVRERPNIKIKQYLALRRKYDGMQKLYFLKPKKRRLPNEK